MPRNAVPEVLTTISAETVSTRKPPLNLKPEHLTLFEHDLQRLIPETRLLKFENIRVSSDGVLFTGAKILPESFAFPDQLDDWKLRSILKFLVTNYLLRRNRRIDTKVLWITDYWSKAYFHWLTDALTRLLATRDRSDELLLMLPEEYQNLEYVESSLRAFGVRNVEFIKPGEVIYCRNLILPTHTAPAGHYNHELLKGVREVLLSSFGHSRSDSCERIYISRRQAAKRRIVNEDEIISVLREFNFQTIYAEEHSFAKQIELFSSARYIVSNHGAGLTNMLFMQTGGSVLELRHKGDRIRNWFFNMSSALDLNYFYQICQRASEQEDPHSADLFVNAIELEQNLHLLIGDHP